MRRGLSKVLVALMFFIGGLFTIGFGCYLTFFQSQGFSKTTAVITRIDETMTGYDSDNHPEYSYDVYVDYTVDGVEYHGMSDFYAGDYEEGKQITIFYNPDDPTEIHGDGKGMGIYMIVLGPVLIVVAAFALLRK